LCESEAAVTIRIEVPGVRAENIRVGLTGSQLRVYGEKKRRVPRGGSIQHLCSERAFGHFNRTVSLRRWTLSVREASTELSNGVLIVHLPKATERRGAEFRVTVKETQSGVRSQSQNKNKKRECDQGEHNCLLLLILTPDSCLPQIYYAYYKQRRDCRKFGRGGHQRSAIADSERASRAALARHRYLSVYDRAAFRFEEKSIRAVDEALGESRMILLASQKDLDKEEPAGEDLYSMGTVAVIMRMLKLPDGRIRILVQGLSRARVEALKPAAIICARNSPSYRKLLRPRLLRSKSKRSCVTFARQWKRLRTLAKNISPEVMAIITNLDDAGRLADLSASNLELKVEDAQSVLDIADTTARLHRVNELLNKEIEVLTVQQEINTQARAT
jgi:HSP20 family molecular chaperone IbpA/Lon protease-like protein